MRNEITVQEAEQEYRSMVELWIAESQPHVVYWDCKKDRWPEIVSVEVLKKSPQGFMKIYKRGDYKILPTWREAVAFKAEMDETFAEVSAKSI